MNGASLRRVSRKVHVFARHSHRGKFDTRGVETCARLKVHWGCGRGGGRSWTVCPLSSNYLFVSPVCLCSVDSKGLEPQTQTETSSYSPGVGVSRHLYQSTRSRGSLGISRGDRKTGLGSRESREVPRLEQRTETGVDR